MKPIKYLNFNSYFKNENIPFNYMDARYETKIKLQRLKIKLYVFLLLVTRLKIHGQT